MAETRRRRKADGSPYRVLVLNCFTRNALAIFEALDPDIEVIGACTKAPRVAVRKNLQLPVRVESIHSYRDYNRGLEDFEHDLVEIIRSTRADCVIPAGTEVSNLASTLKRSVQESTGATVCAEDPDTHFRLADKWPTYELCKELGIPVPEAIQVESMDEGEAAALSLLPCVIKPRSEANSIGVYFFHTKRDVDAWKSSCSPAEAPSPDNPCMVQRFIQGELHDATAYAVDGQPKALLTQQRLVTVADFGGGGIVNQTTDEPTLKDYATRILKHLDWNGVCEFDFIRDGAGEFYLLESNPKFWGTTDLTVKAGLNVPQMAFDHQVLGWEIEEVTHYEVGLLYRWMLPSCTAYWLSSPRHPTRVLQRIRRTFARRDATRTITQMRWGTLGWLPFRALQKVLPGDD